MQALAQSFYVYEHWRPDLNVPFYVGKGCGRRAYDFRRGRNRWHRFVSKKCKDAGTPVETRIIIDGIDEELAFLIECEKIAAYRREGVNLVNLSDGGEGPSGHKDTPEQNARRRLRRGYKLNLSEEQRAAIKERSRGRKTSDETKIKISLAKKGTFPTAEHRAKLSAAKIGNKINAGRVLSEERKEQIRVLCTGWKQTEEAKAKISARHKGETKSPSHRRKIAETLRRRNASNRVVPDQGELQL